MVEVQHRSALTRSQQDYLKALYLLHGDQRPVPTGDLAQRLGISSPSVSEMVTRLSTQGLVDHDRHRGQQLTREGRKVALELVRHHRLLEMFLVQVLGYSLDEVHDEAERLEHVIPTLTGKVRPLSERPLSSCRAGERVVVQGVSDEDAGRLRELERRGLLPGTRIEITKVSEYEGPLECRIKGRRVSVPLGLARAVFVEGDAGVGR